MSLSRDAFEMIGTMLPSAVKKQLTTSELQRLSNRDNKQDTTNKNETENDSDQVTPIEELSKLMEQSNQSRIVSTLKELVRVHGAVRGVWAILVKLFDKDVVELKQASEGRLKFIRKIDFLKLAFSLSSRLSNGIAIDTNAKEGTKQESTKKEENICKQEPPITKCVNQKIPILSLQSEEKVGVKAGQSEIEVKVIKEDSMKVETETNVIQLAKEKPKKSSQKSPKREDTVKPQIIDDESKASVKTDALHEPIRQEADFEDIPDRFLVDELRTFLGAVTEVVSHTLTNAERLTKVSFDKDVASHVQVVKSLTNMRCFVYRIKSVDEEELRKKLGNIVPAISHTNAIIAGMLFENMQKVFLREFLQERVKHLEVDINMKNLDQLSKREQLLLHILKTREFALVNSEIQKLVNISNMRPKKDCATCSVPRHILHVPSSMSLKHFGKNLAELMKMKEIYIFFKGELLYEQFEDEESSDEEPFEAKLSETELTEITKKVKHDRNSSQLPGKGGFGKVLELIESKKRKSGSKDAKKDVPVESDLVETSQKLQKDPETESTALKSKTEEDVSKDRIRELVILDQNSVPQCVVFLLISKEARTLKLVKANQNESRFDFVEKELKIPHLNNYILGKRNSAVKVKNVCSLESDSKSKSKSKNPNLEKRSKGAFHENKKPAESIMADFKIDKSQSKRVKLA